MTKCASCEYEGIREVWQGTAWGEPERICAKSLDMNAEDCPGYEEWMGGGEDATE